ncbi:MAG TPA: hypothetical protein ENI52_01435 [Thermoplasmata archaeon]|nr:hypothetical protein [Thermoplasmata archaeon]
MKKEKEIHIRLTTEQYRLLKALIPNVSSFIRQKIEEELQDKLPERLKKRKEELKQELEEIEEKLALLQQQYKKEREQHLEKIYQDFIKYERYQYADSLNLQWLKGRYCNLPVPIEECLEYCKRKCREGNEQ